MEPLGYYKWHWQAWRANRRVQRMTCLQKGIYRELLDECWADGSIPDDISALADIAGCTEQELTDAWQLLSKCFYEVTPGRLTNRKLEEQRTETDALRATRSRAGEAGGKQKLANAKQLSGTCHIEEREEKRKRVSPRDKRESVVHPFFGELKELIFRYYRSHNKVEPEWNGREAKELSSLLSANPDAPITHWKHCLVGRNDSEVNHAERPGKWIGNLSSYRNAVNAFNRPKAESTSSPKPIEQEIPVHIRAYAAAKAGGPLL